MYQKICRLSRQHIFWFVMVSIFVTACSATVQLKPRPSGNQKLVYQSGAPLILSEKQDFVALGLIPGLRISGRRSAFAVIFINSGKIASDFSTDNIKVYTQNEALKVYSYEELKNEQEGRQRIQRLGLALQGFGAVGQGDSLAQMRIDQQADQLNLERTSFVQTPFLRKQTVFPGQSYTGVVVFDLPNRSFAEEVLVAVEIKTDTDVHTFNVLLSEK